MAERSRSRSSRRAPQQAPQQEQQPAPQRSAIETLEYNLALVDCYDFIVLVFKKYLYVIFIVLFYCCFIIIS